jgi:bla regulator protein BlaR1
MVYGYGLKQTIMQNLLYNISQVLGITIIHSLWQGLIIYIALRLFLAATPALSSATKHRVSYATLLGTLGWFLVTLFQELNQYNWLSTTALQITPLTLPAVMQEVNAPANQLYFAIAQYMPYLTMIYVVGVVFNTLKLTLAWNSIYRIRQNISDAGFDSTIKRLSAKLNVAKPVQAAFSEWVDVPCVTGFIKPIILLPVTLTTYLSADEIEAILMHELAHVKRNDYLFNFIQQVVGILLFFNPFARLITNIINQERENCCDDAVVRVTGSPFVYAQALLKLEENKQQQWQLTLAAVGKKYHLLNRIERIMKTQSKTVNIRPVLITTLALTFAITSIAWLNPEIKDGKVVIKNAPAIKKVAAAIISTTKTETEVVAKPKRKREIKFTDLTAADDTTKKKYKIVVEDEYGVKTEYSSVEDLPAGDRNDFLSKTANLNFNPMDSVALEKLRKLYTSDAWKKQVETLAKTSEKMAKQFSSPKWQKAQKKMVEQSLAMAEKFNSPEFKKRQEEMIKKSIDMAAKFNTPEFKRDIDQMTKSGKLMERYNNSPEFKSTIEKLTKYYSTPQFQKEMDNMAKYYDSPEFQKQAAEMGKYQETAEFKKMIKGMTEYYDSPEFKKNIKELTKYYESPEFKKQMEDMGKGIGEAMSRQFDGISKDKAKKVMKNPKTEYEEAQKAFEKDSTAMERELKKAEEAHTKEIKP